MLIDGGYMVLCNFSLVSLGVVKQIEHARNDTPNETDEKLRKTKTNQHEIFTTFNLLFQAYVYQISA
jgi:hypothetical protein